MVRKVMYVKWGDLYGTRAEFMILGVRRADHRGVRASIRAMNLGNAGGAKGCRKVDM